MTSDLDIYRSANELIKQHGDAAERLVKAYYIDVLKDPETARFGRVTRPIRAHAIANVFKHEAVYGYSVCATVNARNSYGGYTGRRATWFLIYEGRIVQASTPGYAIYIDGPQARCVDGPPSPD